MRIFLAMTAVVVGLSAVRGAELGEKKSEIKGTHLCCKQCEVAVNNILAKVPDIANVNVDRPKNTISFTSKDQKAAEVAFTALFDGGFTGKLTFDGNAVAAPTQPASKEKTNKVVLTKVHICCGACINAIKGLFEGSKITVVGTGAQRDLTVEGTDLTQAGVLETLNKAGFNGKLETKK